MFQRTVKSIQLCIL